MRALFHGGLALAVAWAVSVGAAQKPSRPVLSGATQPLDVARLLDAYAAGRFDEAVARVAQAGDQAGRALRARWKIDASSWCDADPDRRRQRLLAAAALALETESVRVERGDWSASGDQPCPGSCVLDWAEQRLVARGSPDQAERAWYLAASALVAGTSDWNYLHRPPVPGRRPVGEREPGGLVDRALLRFPGDPQLRLEQALAAAGRFTMTRDGDGDAPDRSGPRGIFLFGGRGLVYDLLARPHETAAIELLTALVSEPVVGPEASVRLGYLLWVLGRDVEAMTVLTAVAERTKDADPGYLAHFLLGRAALVRGDEAATAHLRAALDARPDSQSAALALASLQLRRGEAQAASDIAQSSLDKRPRDDDPWRLFLYGHYSRLPALLAELRRLVRP